jgi:amino acid transporter
VADYIIIVIIIIIIIIIILQLIPWSWNFLEKPLVAQLLKNSSKHFMEPEGLSSCSKVPTPGP